MTLAFAIRRGIPIREVIPYSTGQFAGAFCAATLLFVMFGPMLDAYEKSNGVVRSESGSVVTARCYGEYYSSPDSTVSKEIHWNEQKWQEQSKMVPHGMAFLTEMFGTAILAMVVLL